EGKQINHKAVQRLMGTLSLKAAIKVKRYRSYRGEVGQTAPNVTNGAIVIHTQCLKSDPGGNLLS
ncbi:hypothetical protein LAY21_23335, partial [Escherichia coli]|nr:hypothetical protein [Escherichia coli]